MDTIGDLQQYTNSLNTDIPIVVQDVNGVLRRARITLERTRQTERDFWAINYGTTPTFVMFITGTEPLSK